MLLVIYVRSIISKHGAVDTAIFTVPSSDILNKICNRNWKMAEITLQNDSQEKTFSKITLQKLFSAKLPRNMVQFNRGWLTARRSWAILGSLSRFVVWFKTAKRMLAAGQTV